MFAYEELKKRVPEPEEEMTGPEAINYFKAKTKKKKGMTWYSLVVNDILSRTNFREGSILDVGCGGGGLLREFQNKNPNLDLTGVDASKTLLNAARKISKLNLRYSYAERLNIGSEKLDLVVCQDTFHHFKKPVSVLKEMFRVIKKGSFIYIVDLKRDVKKESIERALKDISKDSISHAIFYLQSVKAAYTATEIKDFLKKANIKNYKLFDGKGDSSTQAMINKISDKRSRENKDRLFRERWVVVIKK